MFRDESDLFKVPGHVRYGWRNINRKAGLWVPHTEDQRNGHTHDSEPEKASAFPEGWSHRFMVDVVRSTIEAPGTGVSAMDVETEEDFFWWVHRRLSDPEALLDSENALAAGEWEAATQGYLAAARENGSEFSEELKDKVLGFYDQDGDDRDSFIAILS